MDLSISFQTAFSGLTFIVSRPRTVLMVSLLYLLAVGVLLLPNFWILSYPASPTPTSQGATDFLNGAKSNLQRGEQSLAYDRQWYASHIARLERQAKDPQTNPRDWDATVTYSRNRQETISNIQRAIDDLKRDQISSEEKDEGLLAHETEDFQMEQRESSKQTQQNWSQGRSSAYWSDPRSVTTLIKTLPVAGLILLFAALVVGLSAVFRGEGGGAEAERLLVRVGQKERRVAIAMGRLFLLYLALSAMSVVLVLLSLFASIFVFWGHPGAEKLELLAFLIFPISGVVGLIIWLILIPRFGACLPMAFYDGNSSLHRAWMVTKSKFLPIIVSNCLIAAQLALIGLAIYAIHYGIFDVRLGLAARPSGTPWTPPILAQEILNCLVIGMVPGPVTAIVAAPMARVYKAKTIDGAFVLRPSGRDRT